MKRFLASCLLVSLGLVCACKKSAPIEESGYVDPLNRVENTPKTASISLVHGTFRVSRYAKYEFEVPAHSSSPRLAGSFEAFLAKTGSEPAGEANVDFLVMTPDEYETLAKGGNGTASYSVTDTHAQTVDYALPPTLESPQKYYVVFRSAAGKARPVSVTADVTVSF